MKKDGCRICPPIDELIFNVIQLSGFFPFCRMFVDNGLTAAPRLGYIKNLVAASIQTCYILLGYPGLIKKPFLPPMLAWDRMCNHLIGTDCVLMPPVLSAMY